MVDPAAGTAQTANPGAYMKLGFTGDEFGLVVDGSALGGLGVFGLPPKPSVCG